jgi:hypothetical protein
MQQAATMQELTQDKLQAEISKLMAETSKINAEARWYPFVAVAGVFGAALALAKFLF